MLAPLERYPPYYGAWVHRGVPVSDSTNAVIEIGSTGIRMLVANVTGGGKYEILERAGKPVALGRDVFTTGIVSRESTRVCIAVLRGFRELLRAYGVEPAETRVVATSALREAENRDAYVDRVAMRTGFRVDVIEAIEESHYMYLAVQRALGGDARYFARMNSIILEVGGGSTELMLLRRGRIVAAHSLRLGTVRIDEQSRAAMGSSGYLMRFLADNVRTACDGLEEDLPLAGVRSFIVIGTDARFAARVAGTEARSDYRIITREAFLALVDRFKGLSIDGIVSEYRIPYAEAEALVPGLVILALFLARTGAEELIVPFVSLRDGILIGMSGGAGGEVEAELHKQVIASVLGLGRRYHFDEQHASGVVEHALFLFDRLRETHGMGTRERLLLEAAGYLHDIGNFVRTSGHQKHSEYIVLNSEIFGLQRDQLRIVANLVRYHRKAGPSQSHPNYMSLSREDRAAVLKLSAILRVADALDRGHTQRLKLVDLEMKEDHLVLQTDCQGDLSLERLSLGEKSDMFEDVFGLKVVIL
ncbi:MAG: Ppx/GppA family phosphatase [Spirochaetales bacterium]|nr:Ppx/GppA family phosphatase [Spirochaetales bacterium]